MAPATRRRRSVHAPAREYFARQRSRCRMDAEAQAGVARASLADVRDGRLLTGATDFAAIGRESAKTCPYPNPLAQAGEGTFRRGMRSPASRARGHSGAACAAA